MKLGRGSGRRSLLTPNTSGIARRAEARLSSMAEAYAAKTETALAIDGVPLLIWNKYAGTVKCACQPENNIFHAQEVKATNDRSGKPIAIRSQGKVKSGRFRLVNDMLNTRNTSDWDADQFTTTPRDRILEEDYDDELESGFDHGSPKVSEPLSNSPSLLDELDAMSEADGMLTDKLIACPICLGSTYVDAWRPFNGNRLVMDLSGQFPTEINLDVLETSVPKFSLEGSQFIEWSIQMPITWTFIARAVLFDEEQTVRRSKYRLKVILPDDSEYEFSHELLKSLRGNPVLTEGRTKFRLQAAAGVTLEASHFEFIFMNAKLAKAQFPEVEVPYEEEWVDWNLNINIEVSGKAQMKEGSYVVDGKYKRVWKVDSYSKKQLATGVVLGQTASCRALHSFEKMFSIFNIYTK